MIIVFDKSNLLLLGKYGKKKLFGYNLAIFHFIIFASNPSKTGEKKRGLSSEFYSKI